jgi:ferredoxin-type protein NapG
MKRRNFLTSFLLGTAIPVVIGTLAKLPGGKSFKRFLRPPGALAEKDFLKSCIGCGECANVCPNKCIELQGFEDGLENLAKPAIIAVKKPCILCMACTQVCPTGALKKLEPTEEGKLAANMGKAFLSTDVCYSYNMRTCGTCYHACPLPGKAMTIGLYEQPTIHYDQCVGCGLCEQACVQMPKAIRVIPTRDLAKYKRPEKES